MGRGRSKKGGGGRSAEEWPHLGPGPSPGRREGVGNPRTSPPRRVPGGMLPLKPAQDCEARPHTRREAGARVPRLLFSEEQRAGARTDRRRPPRRALCRAAAPGTRRALGLPGRTGAVPPRPRGHAFPGPLPPGAEAGGRVLGCGRSPGPSRLGPCASAAAGGPAWAARVAAPSLPVQDSPDAPRSSREGN